MGFTKSLAYAVTESEWQGFMMGFTKDVAYSDSLKYTPKCTGMQGETGLLVK